MGEADRRRRLMIGAVVLLAAFFIVAAMVFLEVSRWFVPIASLIAFKVSVSVIFIVTYSLYVLIPFSFEANSLFPFTRGYYSLFTSRNAISSDAMLFFPHVWTPSLRYRILSLPVLMAGVILLLQSMQRTCVIMAFKGSQHTVMSSVILLLLVIVLPLLLL